MTRPPPSFDAQPRPSTAPRATRPLHSLIALVAGLAIGLVIAASGASAAGNMGTSVVRWLDPLGTLWVNAIRMTVIPLVVSSLIVAVSDTEPRTVGRLGSRALLIFLALLSLMALITALVAPMLFERLVIDPAAAQAIRAGVPPVARPELPGFASFLVSLVPANPVKAAADGAMLPLVVFTLALGLALGRLTPDAREPVIALFRSLADAMTRLVQWVLVVTPIGVFVLALSLAAKLGASVVGAVGFYIAVHASLLLVAVVLMYAVVVFVGRVPLMTFARAALPAQMVAMTTRSSMAALPAMLTSANQTLKLPPSVTSFALPFATSTFRLNSGVSWVVVALFAAKLYGVELATSQIATIAITSVLLSFSVPGIPSASLFIIAPVLAAVGIPPEAIGVLIAVDLIPDVFKTLANVTGHLVAVTLLGRQGARPPLGH